jgi:hypothetical protein
MLLDITVTFPSVLTFLQPRRPHATPDEVYAFVEKELLDNVADLVYPGRLMTTATAV